MKTPPVTVTCECGAVRLLRHGERWECETCGRRWDTAQIPAEDYATLTRALRRYQLQSLAFAVVLVAVFAPLMILIDVRIGITGLIVFFFWAFMYRPWRRRRLLEELRGASSWELTPEQ